MQSQRLNPTRLRISVFLVGILFIIALLLLRSAYAPEQLDIDITVITEPEGYNPLVMPFFPTFENVHMLATREALETYLYEIDETAYVFTSDLDIPGFLNMDFRLEPRPAEDGPRVLIFHTHSQEAFINSRPGEVSDTIVGVGALLAEILAKEYGIPVVHDQGRYDIVGGVEHRTGSYERMEPAIRNLLHKYPTIEVVIDLHRDSVPYGVHLLKDINGLPTARIMFFNGITRLNQNGKPIDVLEFPNPYVHENMGLSLQMQLMSNTLYPGFARNIYIKPYRYSLHFMPRSLLIEVGAENNTIEEARNAMLPLAEILARVLFPSVNQAYSRGPV